MARPVRESLDYYPFDVDFFNDIKIKKLKIKSGYDAILILIYLYTLIYGDKGYYTKSEDAMLLMMDYFQKDENEIKNIICLFMDMNLIDKNMHDKYKIFTSLGIQKRYLEVAKRRKGRDIKKDYCLVNVTETPVNVTETPVNVTETPVNVTFSTQRKGKKRKEKERKERGNTRACATPHSPSLRSDLVAYGKLHNVLLTTDEYALVTDTYENPKQLIGKVGLYLANARREYPNHYALIEKFAFEDGWPKKPKTSNLETEPDKEPDFVPTDEARELVKQTLAKIKGGGNGKT